MPNRPCPCGSGLPTADCCGRLHAGTAAASTAEQLMRSRYSAFALGDAAYLRATWHTDTRPRRLELDPAVRWAGLEILARSGGTMLDSEGTVEFRAHHVAHGRSGSQHETSRFLREAGQWRYLEGISLG